MNAKNIAEQVLQEVGGERNVKNVTHCVTRLRFNLNSLENVDEQKIKNISGVLGVVNKGGQFQVIIGPNVAKVYGELIKLGDFDSSKGETEEKEKQGIFNKVLDTIAGIFSPIMPIIAGAGMIKALLSILTLFNLIDKSGNVYYFLNFIADASYYFLPIFLASATAKKFQCNSQMAMLMGAILLHPSFIALKDKGDMVKVLGLPIKIVTYSSSVIPIILIVILLSYVEKLVEKITPSMIKFIAKPLFTILIMVPISLGLLGPLGSFIGDGLVYILLSIESIAPWILPTVIGAFMPFLVMTGMHYSLLPAYVNALSTLGHESIIGPGNLPSNIAQGAAALCVAVKTKNKDLKQLAVSSGVTALLGVTEPALFGVNLRLKKPLIATTIGGGLGGLYAGVTGVLRFGGGGAGLAAIGLYVGENPSNVINALISAAIAFMATFVILWYIGFEDIDPEVENKSEKNNKFETSNRSEINNNITENKIDRTTNINKDQIPNKDELHSEFKIYSPLKGKLIPLSQVNDPVFSGEMMGKGVAIKPEEGKLYSPVNGRIASIFDTKHAIGIIADNGAEILIHVGMDTVQLGGKYFDSFIKVDDVIKKGDLLLEFNCEEIQKQGYDTVTPIIITNSNDFKEIIKEETSKIEVGDIILNIN